MPNKLDVIIFGASGFTGKYCVLEAVNVLYNLKWGIAGRSRAKLEAVLKEMAAKAKKDLSKIPITVADINDEKLLLDMASKAKVIVNTCGPYRFFGEQVVKACIKAVTHHVDVSGESQYMESMQLKYNDIAREKGVYVVSACGFDSIPADMGLIFLERNFEGVLNSVETYLQSKVVGGRGGGPSIHYGTWESAVYGMANTAETLEIRSKLFKERLPKFLSKLKASPPTKNVITKVTGTNPGYGATWVSVLVAATTILRESDKMPESGGMLPPGAAFAKTNMTAELEKYAHGLQFEIVTNKKIAKGGILKHLN